MQEDHLSFLFRANRSLDPLPLAMIASGILMGVAAVRNLKPDRKFAEEISAAPLVIRGAMEQDAPEIDSAISEQFANCLLSRLSGRILFLDRPAHSIGL